MPGSASLPERLCRNCATDLPITGVGLLFLNDSGPIAMIAATDESAARLEDLQLVLGEGPCVDASSSGRPVLQPDLEATGPGRWPHFGPAALRVGVRAIFAFPLHVGGIRLGVLDLYRDSAGMLDATQLRQATTYADAAIEIILHLQAQAPDDQLHPELSEGFRTSPVVHQSTGMIAAQAGVPIAEAFLLLRARAYATGRTLAELATDIVNRTVRWTTEDEAHE
jgi:hypothetical protein